VHTINIRSKKIHINTKESWLKHHRERQKAESTKKLPTVVRFHGLLVFALVVAVVFLVAPVIKRSIILHPMELSIKEVARKLLNRSS